MDHIAQLQKIVGSKNVEILHVSEYARDKSYFTGTAPIAVVFPKDAKHVSKLLALCNKEKIKVVVRGGGSSLTGASVPIGRCIVIDMFNFRKITETHIEDQYVVAQPGVTIDMLNRHLSKYGYFYPPDPASSSFASIGGTISTNAGGLRAVHYGSTKEWVLGLEVVLPNGEIIQTGSRTTKRSIGYDLTSLMIASEGTLCVVTNAVLKIWPEPESIGRAIAYYKTMEDAAICIGKLKESGTIPLMAEFIDGTSMQLMHRYNGINFPKGARYSLIVEIASNKGSMQKELKTMERILAKKAISVKASRSKNEVEKIYSARKHLFLATMERAEQTGKTVIIADIVVPLSQLPSTLRGMEKAIKNQKLEVILFGHIGDGNIHANIIANLKKDAAQIQRLQNKFGELAISHKGSVSGEHGIGLEKKALLVKEMRSRNSEYSIKLMKEIKKVFDPNGILNKGKIFD